MPNLFEICVTNYDLDTAQTLQEVFHSLRLLSGTIDEVYSRIESRVREQKIRLETVNSRIATCHDKINIIRGSNRATTVFSTAKFPGSKYLAPMKSTFSKINARTPYRLPVETTQYRPADPRLSTLTNPRLREEIAIISTRLTSQERFCSSTWTDKGELAQGLGPLPPSLNSTASLLLFNSAVNPYKNYQTQDNLASLGRGREAADEETIRALATAPSTLLSGDALPDIEALDLTFRPDMGTHAALELPSNLPLDFIADVNYTTLALPSIAPSVQMKASSFSTLLLTNGNTSGLHLPPSTDGSGRYLANPSATERRLITIEAAPPPPPPPLPFPTDPSTKIVISTPSLIPPPPPSQQTPSQPHLAGPPPPPPFSAVPTTADSTLSTASLPSSIPSGIPKAALESPRLSLLDSIKSVGASGLRKQATQPRPAQSHLTPSNAPKKPVSMMEEIQERMRRRNSALSGRDDRKQQRRDSAIVQAARLTSTVTRPAPPGRHHLGSGDGESKSNDDFKAALRHMSLTAGMESECSGSDRDLDEDDDADSDSFSVPDSVGHTNRTKRIPAPPLTAFKTTHLNKSTRPTTDITSQIPLEENRGRGNLMDTRNPLLNSMLAAKGHVADNSKSDSNDSGDEEWK